MRQPAGPVAVGAVQAIGPHRGINKIHGHKTHESRKTLTVTPRPRLYCLRPMDRHAKALAKDEEGYRHDAHVLLKIGYKLPGPLRLLARNPAW